MQKKFGCIASLVFLILGLGAGAWGQYAGGQPWHVATDVALCSGGICNMVRITPAPTLLDQFSTGLVGNTFGMNLDSRMHLMVTSNAFTTSTSNAVEISIGSLDPEVIPFAIVPHVPEPVGTAASPFYTDGGSDARFVLVNGNGNIFIGNAGTQDIYELDAATGNTLNIYPISSCIVSGGQLAGDLNANGSFLLTSKGGTIQQFTPGTPCTAGTAFANFPGAQLFGIQDIPANALTGSCQGSTCPATETVLVLATGTFDTDGNGSPDANDASICNSQIGSGSQYCALLLNTTGPGLTQPTWIASNPYCSTQILDSNLHVQQVNTCGTSGTYSVAPFHPAWSTNGGTTIDGAVTWVDNGNTNLTSPPWQPNTPYGVGALIVDSFGHKEVASVAGTSGPTQPTWPNKKNRVTLDGLTWTDKKTSVVARYLTPGNPQALSLDALIKNCTNTGSCSSPTVNDFFLGDSLSSNFYQYNFSNTSNVPDASFDANANLAAVSSSCSPSACTPLSSIQGLRVYGAGNAGQAASAPLTELFAGTLDSTDNWTTVVNFPISAGPADLNRLTATVYPMSGVTPLKLYASLVAQTSASGNNSGATDLDAIGPSNQPIGPPFAPVPCQPTTSDPTKCIMWKIDALPPSASAAVNYAITSPGQDNNTHAFSDVHYDVTGAVGNIDVLGKSTSVQSLHELVPLNPQSACAWISPSEGDCVKTNKGTEIFSFDCPGMPSAEFTAMQNSPGPPLLSLVETFPKANPKPAPQILQLTATNNKATFHFSSSTNSSGANYSAQVCISCLVASGQLSSTTTSYLTGTVLDPTNTMTSIFVDFTVDPTCKK